MKHYQHSTWQRLMALFLSFCLAAGGVPAPTLAEEAAAEPQTLAATEAGDTAESASEAAEEPAAGQNPEAGVEETKAAETSVVAAAEEISTFVTVTVVKDDGTLETWIPKTEVKVAEGATAWDAIKQVLDEYKKDGGDYSYSDSGWGVSIDSITSKDGKNLATIYSSGQYVYWTFLVNDAYSNLTVNNVQANAGAAYELRYSALGIAATPEAVEADDLTKDPADLPADWATFENNGNVTTAPTPTDVSVNWKTLVGYVTEPLIIDGKVYVATSSLGMGSSNQFDNQLKLLRIDEATGKIEATTPLAGTISYTSRPTYHKGLIYIALDGGQIQAINVSTMKTRWVSSAPENGGQAQTSLKVIETNVVELDESYQPKTSLKDVLFSGTIKYGANDAVTGGVLALDALSGGLLPSLTFNIADAGFSWTNFVSARGYVLTGDTKGRLYAVSSDSSGYSANTHTPLDLGAGVNADLAVYKDTQVVVPTRDGVLHIVDVAADGTMTEAHKEQVLSGCTAGAVIVGNLAIIPGRATLGTGSAVVIYDLDAHKVVRTITKADGKTLPGGEWDYLKSPVLVSTKNGKTYCYFTSNYGDNQNGSYVSGGNAYWFELGEDEAHVLYTPTGDAVNVSDSPLIADSTGALYYLNDSGYLVRLTENIADKDKKPELALDEASGKVIARDHTATLTFSQQVPADATTIELWCELPDVLEFVGENATVLVDGKEYAKVAPKGQLVKETIAGDAAVALRPSASNALTASADAGALTAQADEGSAASSGAKTVSLVFDAKVKEDADLKAYEAEKGTMYVVPVTANTRFNEDEARTYSVTKSLKIAKTGSATKPASKAAGNAGGKLAKTGDSSIPVAAIVGAAAAFIVVALILRKRQS